MWYLHGIADEEIYCPYPFDTANTPDTNMPRSLRSLALELVADLLEDSKR